MRKKVDLVKAARFSVVINSIQIFLASVIGLMVMLGGDQVLTGTIEQAVIGIMAAIVVWGAIVDIRDAYHAKHIAAESDMLEEAYNQLESLNGTLRAQRHDFMNHLQVVFSLLEMGDADDAREYIEKVHGDIALTGRALKTAIPAVNALIAAKLNDMDEEGIRANLIITSAWKELPVPGWEMCRVLGNLIDNAADAVKQLPGETLREITIVLGEDASEYRFSVENTGLPIPRELRESIFQAGVSTKGTGRGMGLSIVRSILEKYNGYVQNDMKNGRTRFFGSVPKKV